MHIQTLSYGRLKQQQQQYSDKMVDVPVGAVHRRFDVPVIMPRRYFVTVKVPQIQFIGRNLRLRVDFSFLDAPRTQASSLLPLDPPSRAPLPTSRRQAHLEYVCS